MMAEIEVTCRVWESADAQASGAAEYFASVMNAAIAARKMARIAISGGNTPKATFEKLAAIKNVDWSRVQIYWVDERCVPPDNGESNYGMTKAALLDRVAIPAENVHRMEGELEPAVAAARYESELRNSMRLEGAEVPTFDLVALGMGDDGHTASLFPHTEGLHEFLRLCIPNHVIEKEVWRITLTYSVINRGREVVFLIEGAGKADILKRVMTGAYKPEEMPSQAVRPASGRLTLLLDKAAAAGLPVTKDGGTFRVAR
jgi:6-phosphogluconolactonase